MVTALSGTDHKFSEVFRRLSVAQQIWTSFVARQLVFRVLNLTLLRSFEMGAFNGCIAFTRMLRKRHG